MGSACNSSNILVHDAVLPWLYCVPSSPAPRPTTTIPDTTCTAALDMAATPDLRPTGLPTCATTDPDTLPTDIWTGTDTASTTPDMETSTPPPTPPSERFPPDTEPDMALLP